MGSWADGFQWQDLVSPQNLVTGAVYAGEQTLIAKSKGDFIMNTAMGTIMSTLAGAGVLFGVRNAGNAIGLNGAFGARGGVLAIVNSGWSYFYYRRGAKRSLEDGLAMGIAAVVGAGVVQAGGGNAFMGLGISPVQGAGTSATVKFDANGNPI